jgi:hypothetical protein
MPEEVFHIPFMLREDSGVGYIPFSGQIVFGVYTILSKMSVGWWIGSNRYFEFVRAQIENAVFRYGLNRLLFFFPLRLLRLRGADFRKRVALIYDHGHSDSRDCAEFTRREHRDANAAVAGGAGGN